MQLKTVLWGSRDGFVYIRMRDMACPIKTSTGSIGLLLFLLSSI